MQNNATGIPPHLIQNYLDALDRANNLSATNGAWANARPKGTIAERSAAWAACHEARKTLTAAMTTCAPVVSTDSVRALLERSRLVGAGMYRMHDQDIDAVLGERRDAAPLPTPRRAGEPWTTWENHCLNMLITIQRTDVERVATIHMRSTYAILARAVELGYLVRDEETQAYLTAKDKKHYHPGPFTCPA